MNDNVVTLAKRQKQFGLTLSFIVHVEDNSTGHLSAATTLNQFKEAVAALARTEYPRLKATVISRQEYE